MSQSAPTVSLASGADAGSASYLRRLRQGFARLPFRTKLALVSTSISFVCLLLAGIALATHQVVVLRDTLLQRSQTLADIVAANSEAVLSFDDRAGAEQMLANLRPEAGIEEARILVPDPAQSGQSETFARFARYPGTEDALPLQGTQSHAFIEGRLHVLRPVYRGDEQIGQVYLRVQLNELNELLFGFMATILLLLIFTLLLSWALAQRLQGMITRPVTELLQTAEAVRQNKDYSVRARVVAEDELGRLTHALNAMLAEVEAHDAARAGVEQEIRDLNEKLEAKVRLRTQDLQTSNRDLQEAIDNLQRAQGQLVESEKMAALGGLVAGVAHEINTPIGICVTVASHLNDRLTQLRKAYAEGIRRTDLESFIQEGEQALGIVESNLNRAANLIRSFKRVAVDQGSEDRRRFRGMDYISEVLTSLSPKFKHTGIEVKLEGDDSVEFDSFPGVLAQIVTNMVFNAAVHAFDNSGPGRILIRLEDQGDWVELSFSDNGRGMEESVRQRVFDPFFTTRRSEGGSGLGLHITYNQVTQQLGGTIRCESASGAGTRFVLRFPRVSPEHRRPGEGGPAAA